ncbi:MAG: 50S ribosomal protein L1 [Candidatus Komeilibacteria bacterium]|nr:50S ribosomal protein L1 [Candidatus Komeilibacteria bacterium]
MSKRMKVAKAKINVQEKYDLPEAVKLVKETGQVKFDAAVEIHVRLGIDVKKSDQMVRGTIKLPYGTGKTKRVAAFVGAEKEKDAKEAGAVLVGGEDLIAQIKKDGKTDFDVAVATPDMMSKLAVIAKTLGQKGLMPNPKAGTITTDIKKMVTDLQQGLLSLKTDATGNLHAPVGRISFAEDKLVENVTVFMDELKKMKPDGVKGSFIRAVYLTSTMGPSVQLQL